MRLLATLGGKRTALRGLPRRRWFLSSRRFNAIVALQGLLVLGLSTCLWAAPQFDVFLGYDGIVPEACWFPVVFEVKNDGPPFVGTVEISPGYSSPGQTRRFQVELPTGTLKRFGIPVFAASRNSGSWDIRLLDERGRVRAEQLAMQARKHVAADTPVIWALTRNPSGVPSFRPIPTVGGQTSDMQPTAGRLQAQVFPDNPLVLEGVSTIYLSSEKVFDFKESQVKALEYWLNAGGHLIVGLEEITDVSSTPWLRGLFPCELKEMTSVSRHAGLEAWVRKPGGLVTPKRAPLTVIPIAGKNGFPNFQRSSRPVPSNSSASSLPQETGDPGFDASQIQVATCNLVDGQPLASADDVPLLVSAPRGRGRITALLFSPEREPVRSWKSLPDFWGKLAQIPAETYAQKSPGAFSGGQSSDAIFGAMLDTRQIHKLPVEWLLVLLIVYLVVIGPLDQYWLKRIGRPMLTWITFPCYVVFFSLLIYFIGYKLRAGESEWNALHLVDVLLHGDRAELRGRTYASLYSPSNQRFILQSQLRYAALRGEFATSWGGVQASDKANVLQTGDNFKAEVFVPVWSSQLLVSDWWEAVSVPLALTIQSQDPDTWQVTVANQTGHKLSNAHFVIEDRLFNLGELGPSETRSVSLARSQGASLADFLARHASEFQAAVAARRQTFASLGSTAPAHIDDVPGAAIAISFLAPLNRAPENNARFVSPPGLDLSTLVDRGSGIFFAWADDYSPAKPINQFSPRRFHQGTMWRVAASVQ